MNKNKQNSSKRKFFIDLLLKFRPKGGWFFGVIIIIISVAFYGIIQGLSLEYYTKFSKGDTSDKYIAVVITSKSDATFTIPEEFRKGFGNGKSFKSSNTNQNISYRKIDDFLSKEQAKIIANKLINDEDCVLIIGNSTSSLTEVTLNAILGSKKSKLSFLLPIATADNIMDKSKDQKYGSILRMMPNNDEQAKTIKNFIFSKYKTKNESPKVVIFSDEDNTTYSHNLSQKIADKIILSKGNIVLKKDYGNSNRFINDYKILKDFNLLPDVIVFVGISTNGSLLNEELKNLNLDIPVIFTDGCTVKNLMDKSKKLPNHYFISAVDKSENEYDSPTYQPVGIDARDLSNIIINEVKGSITRESVSKYITNNKEKIIMENGKAGKYQFNSNGENNLMNWKVYSYVDEKLEIIYNGK